MNKLEGIVRRWFVSKHGEGAGNQPDFYRCLTCGKLATWNKIRSGNMCCSSRIVPTNPTFLETLRLFLLPWTF
jgi:hypothetical protein